MVVVATAVLAYTLRQESIDSRDPPEADHAAPAVPVGAVAVAAPGRGPTGEGALPSGASRPLPGGAAVAGEGSPAAIGAQGAAPSEGTPPSSPSDGDEAPPKGGPAAPGAGSSPSGPAPAGADAGAPSSGGSSSSGASRGAATASSRTPARAMKGGHLPDGGALADAGRASSAKGESQGGGAQAESNGAPGEATPRRDGGVLVASRGNAALGRIAGGSSNPPGEGQPSAPGEPRARSGAGAYAGSTALERKLAALERSRKDEEGALRQVDRFVPTGGVTLTGRVVDADGGKPIVGSEVHVHHEGTLVEGATDATGAFKLPGMVGGSHVVVWVGRAGDPYIDERIELTVAGEGDTADAGTFKLLRGDELTAKHEGWVGLFVNRRGGQTVVAGVTPWTPADEARLEVGDQLVSVDGRDLAGLGPRAVTYLLRGRVGTSVALVVRSPGGQRRKISLVRAVR